MAFDTALRHREMGRPLLADLVEVGHLQEGVVQDGPVALHALPVPHPPVEHAFALRFDGTRRVVFSGDTAHYTPLAAFARGADVLLHSACLPGQVEALAAAEPPDNPWARAKEALELAHASVGQVGRIAQAARVRHLVLHHLIPAPGGAEAPAIWADRVRERWNGLLTVGHDGLEVPL
jgi:ribonuclease BN (tRNA processing enzyme)